MSFISKSDFRAKFSIKGRTITLESTGDSFKVRPLNMVQKRQIREANMKIHMPKAKGEQATTELDLEGMIIDTLIAACESPSFDEGDREWLTSSIDSTYIQELYEAIDTPVKLATLTKEELGNSKTS